MPKRNFRYEFIREILEGVDALHINEGHSEENGSYSDVVFYTKDDGKHYMFHTAENAFYNWGDDEPVECDEVEEQVVTVKKWKKVRDVPA